MSDTIRDQTGEIDDVIEPYVDSPDDDYDESDYPGGTSPRSLSLPDDSPRIELVQQIQEAVREEIERERRNFAGLSRNVMKVDQNVSGEILFSRYSVSTGPIQICREKNNRGRVLIRIVPGTDGAVSIGRHTGIMASGGDTATVYADIATLEFQPLEIRTRLALWAVASTDAVIEVIEEFA